MDRFYCTITRLCSLSGLYGQVLLYNYQTTYVCSLSGLYGQVLLYNYQTMFPEWSLWTGSTVLLPDYVH